MKYIWLANHATVNQCMKCVILKINMPYFVSIGKFINSNISVFTLALFPLP